MKKNFIIICIILFSLNLFAGGFQLNEHGSKAMALGGAFTGLANDASAVYYNPGAVCFLEGTQFYAGPTAITPIFSFRGVSPEITEYEMKDQTLASANLYLTHQVNDQFSIGFSFNNQYGLKSLWEDDWVGRYLAVETGIKTYWLTPVISYKVNEKLSFGGGFSYIYSDVIIKKMYDPHPFDVDDAEIKLEGDDKSSFAYTLGLFYKPVEKFSCGISFRSEAELDFEGEAEAQIDEDLAHLLPYGDISSSITTPANLTIGLAYKPTDKLTATFDYQYIGWSSYDKLEVEFDENSNWNTSENRDFEDAYIIRTGLEYKLKTQFALRTGLLYDNNPVVDEKLEPTLPDTDRIGYNIGFGYDFGNGFYTDAAYLLLRGMERKIDNSEVEYVEGEYLNGVYNMSVHLMSLNLGYKF